MVDEVNKKDIPFKEMDLDTSSSMSPAPTQDIPEVNIPHSEMSMLNEVFNETTFDLKEQNLKGRALREKAFMSSALKGITVKQVTDEVDSTGSMLSIDTDFKIEAENLRDVRQVNEIPMVKDMDPDQFLSQLKDETVFSNYAPDIAYAFERISADNEINPFKKAEQKAILATEGQRRILLSVIDEIEEERGFIKEAGRWVYDQIGASPVTAVSNLSGLSDSIGFEGRLKVTEQLYNIASSNASFEEIMEASRSVIIPYLDTNGLEASEVLARELFDVFVERGYGEETESQDFWRYVDVVGFALDAADIVKYGAKGVKVGSALIRGENISLRASKYSKEAEERVAKLVGQTEAENLVKEVFDADDANDVINASAALSPSHMKADGAFGDHGFNKIKVARDIVSENSYLDEVVKLTQGTRFEDDALNRVIVTPDGEEKTAIKVFKEKFENTHKNVGNNPVSDYTYYVDEFDNLYGAIEIANNEGKLFSDIKMAEEIATEINGVVKPQISGGVEKYSIVKTYELNPSALFRADDPAELKSGLLARIGSARNQTTERLFQLASEAEGIRTTAINKITKKLNLVSDKAMKVDKLASDKVEGFLTEVRDGSLAHIKDGSRLSEEFSDWHFRTYKTFPKEEVKELFKEVQDLNDAIYYLKADKLYKQAINKNVEIAMVGARDYRVVKKDMDLIPSGEEVFNVEKGVFVKVSDLIAENESGQLFKVLGSGEQFLTKEGTYAEYILVKNPKVRMIRHSDVLPYNAGTSRKNKGTNFFVKQETEFNYRGKVKNGTPKTLLAARTEKEALKATTQINNVLKFLRTKVDLNSSSEAILDSIRALGDNPQLMKVLQENRGFNINIQDAASLARWVDDSGLDISKDVGKVADGERLITGDPEDVLYQTYGEVAEQNLAKTSVRKNKVLLGYGGQQVDVSTPLQSVVEDMVTSVSHASNAAYLETAYKNLIINFEGSITNLDEIIGLSPVDALKRMRLTDSAKNAEYERLSILRRVNASTNKWTKFWDGTFDAAGDMIYDNAPFLKKQLADALSGTLKTVTDTSKLKSFAFFTKVAPTTEQFGVQAFGASTSVILSSSKIGMKEAVKTAGAGFPLLRTALMFKDNPEMIAEVAKNASLMGLTESQFIDLVQGAIKSGKGYVGKEVADISTQSSASLKIGRGKLRKYGKAGVDLMTFSYTEGELANRLTSLALAHKEMIKVNPNATLSNQTDFRKFLSRSNDLSLNMTNVSSAGWQRTVLSMPLQFMPYTIRVHEAILFGGKTYSKEERIRLAMGMVALHGAQATPIYVIADHFFTDPEVKQSFMSETYFNIRGGLMDFAVEKLLGEKYAVSERLSPGSGVVMFMENVMKNETATLIGGAGGQAATDAITAAYHLVSAWYRDAPLDVSYEYGLKLARNFTPLDRAIKARRVWEEGKYASKNGVVIGQGELSSMDALMIYFGFQPEEIRLSFTLLDEKKSQKNYFNAVQKELMTLQKLSLEKFKNGEYEAVSEIKYFMQSEIDRLPTYEDKKKMRQILRNYGHRELDDALVNVLERQYGGGSAAQTELLQTREE